MAPIESACYRDFLLDLIPTGPILPCFRYIRAFVRKKQLFLYPSPIPAKISQCPPWSRSIMLGSAESEHPKLMVKLFRIPRRHRQTDRRTNRRLCRSNTALCVASRGKNILVYVSHEPFPSLFRSEFETMQSCNRCHEFLPSRSVLGTSLRGRY